MFLYFLITLETCLWVRMSSWDVNRMCLCSHKQECFNIWHSERSIIHQVCWSYPLHEVARDNSRSENWWVYIDKLSSSEISMIILWWLLKMVSQGIVLGHHRLTIAMIVHLNDLKADLHRSVNFLQKFNESVCDLRSGYDMCILSSVLVHFL